MRALLGLSLAILALVAQMAHALGVMALVVVPAGVVFGLLDALGTGVFPVVERFGLV